MFFFRKPAARAQRPTLTLTPIAAVSRPLAVQFANATGDDQDPLAFGAQRAAGGLLVFPDGSAADFINGAWGAVGRAP